MTTLVVVLLLLAALAHASWNALLKGKIGDPLAASTALSITWAVFGLPAALLVEPPPIEAWPNLAASVAIHLVYLTLLVRAYRSGELSFVYPIARGVPPLLLAGFGAVVASELLDPIAIVGVALVGGGVLWLGLSRASQDAPRRPLALALSIALSIAAYTLIDGLGVRAAGSSFGYWLWLIVGQGALFAAGALLLGGGGLRREVWSRRREGLLSGVLSAGGYGVALWAMGRAPIALVAALRETSVLFAATIGVLWLKESFGKKRVAAAALIVAGAILIRVAG